jgi:hypothetical protein
MWSRSLDNEEALAHEGTLRLGGERKFTANCRRPKEVVLHSTNMFAIGIKRGKCPPVQSISSYKERGGVVSVIPNICTGWRWVVILSPRPLSSGDKPPCTHRTRGWEGSGYFGTVKVVSVQAWTGFQEVEAPRLQDNRHMKVARLSALRTGLL